MAKSDKAKRKSVAKAAAKKQAKPKPTIEQLSDQQRQALLFNHKRKLKPLLATEKEAKAAVQAAYEIAKKEGIPKKDIDLAIKLESEEGLEAMKLEVERTQRIARWMGVSRQLDLFAAAAAPKNAEQHFEDGRIAALNDEPAKPPSFLSTKDIQHWLEGHAKGRTALNVQRSEGFRSIGEVQRDLISKVPPTGDDYPPGPPTDDPAVSHFSR